MHVVAHRSVMTLEDAIQRVSALIGQALDWTTLEAFLPVDRRSAIPQVGAGQQLRRRAGTGAAGPAASLSRKKPFAELLVRQAAA